jgi:hypothetical protein
LDNPSETEHTALSISGRRTGKMLHHEKHYQQVPFGMYGKMLAHKPLNGFILISSTRQRYE